MPFQTQVYFFTLDTLGNVILITGDAEYLFCYAIHLFLILKRLYNHKPCSLIKLVFYNDEEDGDACQMVTVVVIE